MAGSINSVVLVGNLTRDPELRATPSGTSVCSLRVAVNDRVKDPTSGEWVDKPNYFDVDVFGGQAERCAQYLAAGVRWPSPAACAGASGRRRTARSARPCPSSPTTSSSSARARAAAEAVAASSPSGAATSSAAAASVRAGHTPFNDKGLDGPPAGDFVEAGDDDIPF